MSTPTTVLVVPCYNEARRLDRFAVLELATRADARVILVDDGSTDATGALLREIAAANPESIEVLTLDVNSGKGEAVRAGLIAALTDGADWAGYCDADFATPPEEIARLVSIARHREEIAVVIGSRVGLLGHHIRRSARRHYFGRVFATLASLVLALPVYDTQCGAKVFRVTPTLRAAARHPFRSRWAFDVELLDRLLRGFGSTPPVTAEQMLEVPLREWADAPASKMDAAAGATALLDLTRIWISRRRGGAPTSLADHAGRNGRGAA